MDYQTVLKKTGIERKDYQEEGIKWMVHLETRTDLPHAFRGGFIADEMGLGKTILCISTFLINFLPKTLIIVPPILLKQWEQEIYNKTSHKALIYHGTSRRNISMDVLLAAPIVLTTYSLIAEKNKGILFDISWDRIVFDEAHHLRNVNNRLIGARQLKRKITWLVSGTPIQNKKQDFYNLCSVLKMPSSYYTEAVNLPEIIQNFILKRTKVQVGIDIPDVNISQTLCLWDNEKERKMSENIHFLLASKTEKKLPLYLQARQFCILPSLCEYSISKRGQIPIIPDAFKGTTKIDTVISTIIGRRYNGNGKLVFCHFKGEIDFIANKLRENGITNICIFDGRMSQFKRSRNIHKAFDVIILQIQTGCEGLNLQSNYSEIYFVSPDWNPFVEQQAIARCHRIGQQKNVNVFRFVMDDFLIQSQDDQIMDEVVDEVVDEVIENPYIVKSLDTYIRNTQISKELLVNTILQNNL